MTRDVTVLNRTQKVQLIHLTMQGLQSKIYYLYENYNSYHENYSEQALQLYNVYNKYESAVQNLLVTEEMNKLDDAGLSQMASLSLEVSELYKLGVRTPDDQKEYEATIAQFKKDVYDEALKRLSDNKKETDNLETDLLAEAKSKGGKNLTPVYEYYNLQKQIDKNQYNIDYAEMMGNSDDYSKYYAINKDLRYKAKVIKENTPLLSHLPYEETIVKDIKKLCSKIRKAQNNVEIQLTKGKYPIWELNPVIAYIFETNEFYTPEKQEYIFDWIQEQERIDQLVDVFKNAIPITLSIMCFFMPGGASIAMLILQGANALAGAAAAYDDIRDAKSQKDMAYSQYPVSEEAQKIIDDADLSAIERNYAMAILSGAFVVLDFVECVKIARKLGIGDEVMKYFAQGRKFRLSADETDDLVRKAGQTVKVTKKGAQKSIKFVNGQITGEITNALKTEPGTAFFWSGCAKVDPSTRKLLVSGDEVAAEIASKCGGTTLETQIKVKNIEMPKWDFDVPDSIKAWEDASAAYAKQVSGDVRAIVGQKLRPENIWENVELPRLLQNPNVSKITTIDPDTLTETVIFERKSGGKVYISQNETLVKNGNWDKILENFNSDPNITEIIDLKTEKSIIFEKGGSKGKWNKNLNQDLKPNTVYRVDGYSYLTDEYGRVNRVTGSLELNLSKERNGYQQVKSVKIKNGITKTKNETPDQGGHIIARIFNGPGEQINYVPQNALINNGNWKSMENDFRMNLESGDKVEVDIKIVYDIKGTSKRPKKFVVDAKVTNSANEVEYPKYEIYNKER